jgi:TPR repeat protein
MKGMLWKSLAGCCLVVALAVAAIIFWNMRLDAGTGALKAGAYAEAYRELRPLAQLGDGHAQYLLGQMYAFGWGVPKSDDDAIRWFRKAAVWSKGTNDPAAAAEYYVGQAYAEGTGVPRNEAESQKWFRRAAAGGYKPSPNPS